MPVQNVSPPLRRFPFWLLVFLVVSHLASCSSSGSTGPEIPGELVGEWEATSMVLTSVEDPETSVDIVQNEEVSGSFVLLIRDDATYEATLTVFGVPETEFGTLESSGSALTFRPQNGSPSKVTWSLSGDQLTMDGETTFDFNRDQQDEEATLHLVLVRS